MTILTENNDTEAFAAYLSDPVDCIDVGVEDKIVGPHLPQVSEDRINRSLDLETPFLPVIRPGEEDGESIKKDPEDTKDESQAHSFHISLSPLTQCLESVLMLNE